MEGIALEFWGSKGLTDDLGGPHANPMASDSKVTFWPF